MLKESINSSRFSPKKSDSGLLAEHQRDLELKNRELENEKLKTQEDRKKYILKLKQYKDTCEKEKHKLLDDLNSKWEKQKTCELQQLKDSVLRARKLEIKQLIRWKEEELRELQMHLLKERDTAVRQARELQKQLTDELINKGYTGKYSSTKKNEPTSSASECKCKLQDVLSKLRWDFDGEQAAHIRHLKMKLDLERSLFMKYILDSSDSILPNILKGNFKPLEFGEIKFGRHSLGSRATRPRSLEDISSSQPQSLENVVPRPQSHDSALSRTRSPECSGSVSPHSSTEKSWKQSPENERIIMPRQRECQDSHTSQINFSLLEANNESTAWEVLEGELHQFPQNTGDSFLNVSRVTEGNICSTSLDSNQSHVASAQNVDTSQHRLNVSDRSRSIQDAELLSALRDLEQRCKDLKEENIILRKSSFPETEEKVKRLKRKNAELAVIAKRLEERAQKLQEANLKMVNTPIHLKGASLELCKKAFAHQRAKDMDEQASALLAKDKQIETLKQECLELQAKLSSGKDFPSWLKLSDFNRLLHESQKEVLRLQRQIAMKNFKESFPLSRSESHSSPTPAEAMCVDRLVHLNQPREDPDNSVMEASRDPIQEVELKRKRKECEGLEQEVKKKQRRCEELETKLQEVQTENARLVEENSRLCSRVKRAAKVDSENADLRRHLAEVTEQRDSALKESHLLQSKLENLEQVLKHMRDVAERRQQLEKDHEDALIALQKRQEEVKRLQQAQVEAKKEHEGAVQLLENTLDTLQAKVKLLEEKCRSQTDQFSLLSGELERFRLQTGNIDLLTSTLGASELPLPQCCSTPGVSPAPQDIGDVIESVLLTQDEKNKVDQEKRLPETPQPSRDVGKVEAPKLAKEKQKPEAPHISSKSESTQESSKSCPTPEVDTASEMEELEADSVSLIPEPETRPTAKLQVFLARYSYNPFDGPNENPEAELPLTAGEYIYIYGDMDDDGFYEGELMDGRRGLVPSNFVERVSDDDLIAFHPGETNELSQSSRQDISFLSGSSIERSEEDDDGSSFSPLPMQGNSEGAADVSAVPYPRKLTLIKQLARSLVVGWEPPLVAAGSGNILSYNIYVDNEIRQNVRCGGQTKALIEKLELKTRTYRISVQSMTETGCSDRMRCTMLVGHGYSLAPTQLRVRSLSATSAEITWQPCNSNYSHALYLNEESCGLAKSGTYWYTFSSLRPSTMYNVKVESRPQRIPLELPIERREPKTTIMQLTTPAAGPPDAPLDVQVELGPKPDVLLITWLPVTIDAAGTSNGVRVTGYVVYADGQKVLEVTSPTAGSVLLGMSHLQLLQVSREISVRTMSPSGESVDSVPAQIPSAFIKVPESSSWSHNFSNTSLICDQASGKNLCSHSEKFPSMPLTSSSPCSLHNPPVSTSRANFSIHISCSRGDSIDSLPVQIWPHLISPVSASSSYCQGSSSSEPSGVQVSCQGTQDKVPSSLPEAIRLPFPERTISDSLEISQTRMTAVQEDSQNKFSNTKEPEIGDQAPASGLPLGITWSKENTIELNTTAKEECSSPEMVLSEEAETTSCSLSGRGASLEDFLQVDIKDDKQSSGTNFCYEIEDTGQLSDTHSSVIHVDHSRSSNLSDILEEEEDDEDEDSNIIPNANKWGQSSGRTGADSTVKLDCCETDSDEEILERILDLPLQKHCSKKLFSIPEVTEDEEEENLSPPMVSKTPHCNMETQKYQCMKAHEAFHQKPLCETCVNLPTENFGKESNANSKKAFGVDCFFFDQDWHHKSKSCVSQSTPDFLKPPVSESLMWNTKRNSHVSERSQCFTEPNRKKQNDGREHCSRLSASSNQAGFYNSRCHNMKEQVARGTAREPSQISHKSSKTKRCRNSQRQQPLVPTSVKTQAPSPFSTSHLEIDIEYDTEDEEERLSPAHYAARSKVDLWEDSSQTDREGWSESSSHSEPIQYIKRKKEVKRPIRAQAAATEYLKGAPSLLHTGQSHGAQQGNSRDDQGSRAASNKTLRTARWECAGKDDWNEDSTMPLHSSTTGTAASDRKASTHHLTSDSESDAAHSTQPEYCLENILDYRETFSKSQEVESVRIFVALFDYDPETMSPNPDAYMEELPFKEGQILQVFGDKDTDGFYQGKYAGRTGYIPCNMVSELHIHSEEVKMQVLRQGQLTSASLLNDLEIRAFSPPPPPPPIAPPGRVAIPPPKPRRSKKVQMTSAQEENNAADKPSKTSRSDLSTARPMVAIFDYNPRESSPNLDVEAELSFTAGDIITVFGPIDEDGFYYGELNGQRGLVPSNYLEVSQAQTEEARSQGTVNIRGEKEFSFDVAINQPNSPLNESISSDHATESTETSERADLYQGITYTKKKKSFFSKGRKLFKKLGSSGKNL